MAYLIYINNHVREEVNLTVYENIFKQPIQRVFFLTNLNEDSVRGGNIPINAYEGIICIQGYCEVRVRKKQDEDEELFILDTPLKCLIIEPYDWHEVINFKSNAILLAFSDKKYNEIEYIHKNK